MNPENVSEILRQLALSVPAGFVERRMPATEVLAGRPLFLRSWSSSTGRRRLRVGPGLVRQLRKGAPGRADQRPAPPPDQRVPDFSGRRRPESAGALVHDHRVRVLRGGDLGPPAGCGQRRRALTGHTHDRHRRQGRSPRPGSPGARVRGVPGAEVPPVRHCARRQGHGAAAGARHRHRRDRGGSGSGARIRGARPARQRCHARDRRPRAA